MVTKEIGTENNQDASALVISQDKVFAIRVMENPKMDRNHLVRRKRFYRKIKNVNTGSQSNGDI